MMIRLEINGFRSLASLLLGGGGNLLLTEDGHCRCLIRAKETTELDSKFVVP